MKQFLSIFFLCLLPCISQGQEYFKVFESNENVGQGINNALCVLIPNTEEKTVISFWKDILKESRAKVRGNKQISATGAIMPNISNGILNLYSTLRLKGNNEHLLIVSFQQDDNTFINSKKDSKAYAEAKIFIEKIALEASKKSLDKKIEDQLSILSKQQKDLEKLHSKKQEYIQDIERYRQLIIVAQTDTMNNRIEQENKILEIEAQQALIKKYEEKRNSL